MLSLLCPEESAHRHVVQEHIRRNETKTDFQHKMKLKFLLNLILSSPGLLIIRVAVYLIYPCMEGSSPFISCWCFRAWFRQNVSDFEYIWEMKTCDQPFWFSCMKADLTFSEKSHLTIFTTKYGGGPFDDVPLLCTLCALSMLFEISSLVVSGKTGYLIDKYWLRVRPGALVGLLIFDVFEYQSFSQKPIL